jgi:purine nucleoside permease
MPGKFPVAHRGLLVMCPSVIPRPMHYPISPSFPKGVQQVVQLNPSLVNWAYNLTKGITLADDSILMSVRAGYPSYPNAVKPPLVLIGDELAADTFWIGDLLNNWAENWITYWAGTNSTLPGNFVMSAFEDIAVSQALLFLSQVGRADPSRELILRSDYTVQPNNQTPAQFLFSENNGGLSGYTESLNDAYIVGGMVVKEISMDLPLDGSRVGSL